MKIKVVAFGIARDIIRESEKTFHLEGVRNIRDLKDFLCEEYADFRALRDFSLAVNEEYQDDSFTICEGDEVVIIPPVSGG